MKSLIRSTLHRLTSRHRPSAWDDVSPVRDALFGVERLEQHAQSLAAAQFVTKRPPTVLSLHKRLDDNASVLLTAYRASAAQLESGSGVVPAAEWLLDNYHLVEEQIRGIRDDLPLGFYRQLPKLATGPFAGYPRVFGLAWAFVAHTDSHFDPETLIRFIAAYQRVQALTIGELWAIAITLRIVLIENLRRLTDQITVAQKSRADAEAFASRLLASGGSRSALDNDIATRSSAPLSELFAAELAKRLRDQDPRTTPALGWLAERLSGQQTSIEEVVQHAQQRQGASNVTVRNVITSMRLISDIDWSELFERVSLVDARLRADSPFADMDFATRNLYRSAIEQLARGSSWPELDIADKALEAARAAVAKQTAKNMTNAPGAAEATGAADPMTAMEDADYLARVGDPGYHLIGKGRAALERTLGFKPPTRLRINRFNIRLGIGGYIGAILLATAGLLILGLSSLSLAGMPESSRFNGFVLLALAGFFPAMEIATTLINRAVTWGFGAAALPGLELAAGVPSSMRTLVAVPTLLTSEADLLEQIERLEVHHLAGASGDIVFALLSDGLDANQETLDTDASLIALATSAIDTLNRRHGPAPSGTRFLLLHRRRLYNPSEDCWMGWERKRGKLHELNRLLRGATDTTFISIDGQPPYVPSGVRYVVTLDADTRLPRDAALHLIGKMAHPLNRPTFSKHRQRIVDGHAILQPRVTPSLPIGREGSLYQRAFSGPGGMDPYASAVSDVYQDLFGEGSFTGKGIYDVDAFDAALHGRVPDNTLLSHDLFEGIFARAGLASDVEVVEESPSRYDVVGKRQHRWTRGDWQLLPWIVGKRRGVQAITPIGRWKMIDNLRRSLLAPFTMIALAVCWILPVAVGLDGIVLVLCSIAIPSFLPSFFSLLPRRTGLRIRSHLAVLGSDLRLATLRTGLSIAFLPDQAWRMGDAIIRTLARLGTRRHLLEWRTAAQAGAGPRLNASGFYHSMKAGTALGLAIAIGVVVLDVRSWPLVLPFALLWAAAPALALWTSRAPNNERRHVVSDPQARELRLIARRTWRFFETFVTPADNMLPPDNFQEDPKPVIAHRTSPTNIGLYLLSSVAARDFGWAGTSETVERLEATFASLQKLGRFKGHFFNWYDTQDLRTLTPAYVSSVDSGNLAGHLIALANACEEWADETSLLDPRAGMADDLALVREAIAQLPPASGERGQPLASVLEEIEIQLSGAQAIETMLPALGRLAEKASRIIDQLLPRIADEPLADATWWIDALKKNIAEQGRDRFAKAPDATSPHSPTPSLPRSPARLQRLADKARALAIAMDFAFLLDQERRLLSIGYSLNDNRLDPSCYDLLASEARLASLFAIAKGDLPTRHWFRLGRTAVPIGGASALISWSGSMFEYLMPSLVMRAPAGSLLEQTNRLVVARQQAYGRSLAIPWGVSESAYNARDLEFTYQYSNFGVPGLGLKRGLADNVVIAPYATGLATMVDPQGALRNYQRLSDIGALGRYGFYEAVDFTRTRLPFEETHAVIRSFMAHHQGMTIVAIANTLHDGQMRARFHREPMIQASELLLQESTPREIAVSQPQAKEIPIGLGDSVDEPSPLRRFIAAEEGPPVTHLLSNGRYAVMLTSAGAGYSRWHDVAITRWKEDATRDDAGAFIFMRDVQSAQVWTGGGGTRHGASKVDGDQVEVIFGEDHAEFIHRGTGPTSGLTTTMHVLVSSEDDGEVRRIALTNSSRRPRDIELTSYAEVVLAPSSVDNAHPAFAKMFVQTEYLPEFGALLATRRPRVAGEAQVWAAHFAVVEGEILADPQYESDRARFLGRNRRIGDAAAIFDDQTLTNTVGTVLDPIFSLRQRVRVGSGAVARIAFWTVVAPSRAELLVLVDRHHDRSTFERAKTLAWTQAQVQLRHLDIDAEEAAAFQRLAAPILYADRRFRSSAEAITRGAGPQSGLWVHGISGDRPIVLLLIDEIEDIAQVRQLLRAHEYWRMKQLGADLVIINERASSYVQDLQIAIETAVRSSQSRPQFENALTQGSVFTLRADLMSAGVRALLRSVARVVLVARRGPIATQMDRIAQDSAKARLRDNAAHNADAQGEIIGEQAIASTARVGDTYSAVHNEPVWYPIRSTADAIDPAFDPIIDSAYDAARSSGHPTGAQVSKDLEFFNGLGGFAKAGNEYVTVLEDGATTPAPWINVIANPEFGFQTSAEGSGYTWAENSRENQLTPWSNDPVCDPSGEAFYVRDEESGALWTPTALPIRDSGTYVARHGRGYSRFEHTANGIALDLLQYVPLADPIKISRLTIRNLSDVTRRLSVTGYAEWVMGTTRGASAPFLLTEIDSTTGAMFVSNPWNIAFPGRIGFADLSGRQTSWTADRCAFLGRMGGTASPRALQPTSGTLSGPAATGSAALSGVTGAGLDPCAALQQTLLLAPGESIEVVCFLGQCQSTEQARALITRYREADLDAVLKEVEAYWHRFLGAVQVKTPDRAMDIMLNGWLLYQTLACRIWARSAFYQASGAYGFRDQLQDGMALGFTQPDTTRHHLLRAAGRQFAEGDVQHWWLPHSGQGVRTRISDDRVWLAFATATYIRGADDPSILEENVPFLEGPLLRPEEHDAFFQPMVADQSASLFEHCARGLDQCLSLTGEHGLPLMGTGDWNDGMNRIGEGGRGESVWLGWLLVRTIALFAPFADTRDPARAERWRAHAESVRTALERDGWDGAWYRRATFDDGTWVGSKDSEECRIDSIAQSWAILSGACDPARGAAAMAALDEQLIRHDDGIALLFTPPFDKTSLEPGYIKGYPPGLRENGGQYSHAAMWAILAFAQSGAGEKATALFSLLNPINHARTPDAVQRYKVEPYVIAADVYSVAPHVGRGGWTWYTGSAGWMYRAGIEGILGIRREGAFLLIDPCIPPTWPGFEATIKFGNSHYEIRVDTPSHRARSISRAVLDGVDVALVERGSEVGPIRVPLIDGAHSLLISI